jgi:hypothetical protein
MGCYLGEEFRQVQPALMEPRLEQAPKQLVLQELLEQPVPLGPRQLELQVLEQRPLEQPS